MTIVKIVGMLSIYDFLFVFVMASIRLTFMISIATYIIIANYHRMKERNPIALFYLYDVSFFQIPDEKIYIF